MKAAARALAASILSLLASSPCMAAAAAVDVEGLSAGVARLRGLPFLQPVTFGTETKAALRQRLQVMFDAEWTGAEVEGSRRALVAFGLVPKDLDLREVLTDLLTEQVAGFYDPKEKKLFLTTDEAGEMSAPEGLSGLLQGLVGVRLDDLVVVHELTHALEDQHFDLGRMQAQAADMDDAVVAFQALGEGTATLTMMLYTLEQSGLDPERFGFLLDRMAGAGSWQDVSEHPVLAAVPAVLRRALTFPYEEGFRFILDQKRRGGWERINDLLKDPPVSSEQILHPEKLEEPRDEPVPVTLPRKLRPRRHLVEDGTLGELDILSVLETVVPPDEARQGAAGWGGDRFALFDQGRSRADLLVWLSCWDSEAEAVEFESILNRVIDSRFPEARPVARRQGSGRHLQAGEAGHLVIERRGPEVLLIQGARRRQSSSLRRKIWRAASREIGALSF